MRHSLLFLLLMLTLSALVHAERIVLQHALTMRNLPAGDLEYKELEGEVEVRYGESLIRFGFGRYNARDGVLDCVNDVEIHESGRVLTSTELTLYEKEEKAVARGRVHITGDSMDVRCRLATWWRALDRLELQSDVVVLDLADSLRLDCGSAMLDNQAGYARATLAPVLTRSGADTLTLRARSVEYWRGEQRALAWKNAILSQRDLEATCDSLVWDNARRQAHLYHNPKILQERREITGDTIRIFLDGERLDSLSVIGNALVLSPADSVSALLKDRLQGDLLAVSFSEGVARRIRVEGAARSVTFLRNDDGSSGMNVADAPRMEFSLDDGQFKSVDMGGGVQAWYIPLEDPPRPDGPASEADEGLPKAAGKGLRPPVAEPEE